MIKMKNIAAISAFIGAVSMPYLADASAGVPYSGDGVDRYIRVINNSDYQIYRIFYAVPGQSYYERDLLASGTVNPGGSRNILVDNGLRRCRFWIKAVTRSGGSKWEKLIDVCAESEFRLGN